jgi:hypothetical protein
MNIMLVSVTERTREIGIRMAIGAQEADILIQFLIEAVVLSLLGGVAGLILSFGVVTGLSKAIGWPMTIEPTALALALGTSTAIGVVFGFFPARRAAQLDPIQALGRELPTTSPSRARLVLFRGDRMTPLTFRLIGINDVESTAYLAAEAARRRYWAQHRTFLACVKCMDGRVLLPTMTGTPVGIVKPFRAAGGRFEAFWPSFLGRVRAWVDDAMRHGSRASILLSYHHSASQPKLGCAGWGYDTAAARGHAEHLRDELAYVFGEELVPLVIGIETDRDDITFHGTGGDVSGGALVGAGAEGVAAALSLAFPALPADVRGDLQPLLLGNARRVAALTATPRDLARLGHDERILAVGQGFDWLAHENLALIVNDADPAVRLDSPRGGHSEEEPRVGGAERGGRAAREHSVPRPGDRPPPGRDARAGALALRAGGRARVVPAARRADDHARRGGVEAGAATRAPRAVTRASPARRLPSRLHRLRHFVWLADSLPRCRNSTPSAVTTAKISDRRVIHRCVGAAPNTARERRVVNHSFDSGGQPARPQSHPVTSVRKQVPRNRREPCESTTNAMAYTA